MKILFTSNPLIGHVYPMLPLMSAAREAGHQVVVATGADFVADLVGRGFDTWSIGPSFAEAVADQQRAADPEPCEPSEPGADLARDAIHLFARPSVRRALDLIPRTAAWQPDLVVSEITEFAGREAAAATGALSVTHGFGTHVPDTRRFAEIIFAAVSAGLGTPNRRPMFESGIYVDPCPPSLQSPHLSGLDTWLVRPSAAPVGPGERLPQQLLRLPKRPVVYLTLGTVSNDPEFARTVLDAIEDLPISIAATTGPGVDPAVLGQRPDNVAVVEFVPQALVLPYAEVVVSHTGSGTMLGALAAGVPQVCLPRGADQFGNAARMQATGAGIRLLPEEVTPERLRAAVRAALYDDTYRRAAGRLQAEITAMPTAEQVLGDLSAAVERRDRRSA